MKHHALFQSRSLILLLGCTAYHQNRQVRPKDYMFLDPASRAHLLWSGVLEKVQLLLSKHPCLLCLDSRPSYFFWHQNRWVTCKNLALVKRLFSWNLIALFNRFQRRSFSLLRLSSGSRNLCCGCYFRRQSNLNLQINLADSESIILAKRKHLMR